MDYSYIFRSAKIKIDSLKAAGFSKNDDSGYLPAIASKKPMAIS